jgi:integrase/recombinase XerD
MKKEYPELEAYLRKRYREGTVKAYLREIGIYVGNCPEAERAGYKEVMGYVGRLRSRYSNRRTLHRAVAGIKVYYDFLNDTGVREDHPAGSIRLRDRPGREIQLQDLFSEAELGKLMEVKRERYKGLEWRNKVLISLLIYQGLRLGEVASLRVEDVKLETGSLYIRATPKSNDREVELKSSQILLLYRYIQEERPQLLKGREEKILILGLRGERMKVEEIGKHIRRSYGHCFRGRKLSAGVIRQSVIANLLKAGHDIRIVQSFAGHKYPGSTEKYKQSEVEELKAAIERYHPIK